MSSLYTKDKISLKESLKVFLNQIQDKDIDVRTLIQAFGGRGYPALLVVIGVPFCFPLQVPGFSTPFGLLLAYMGLRIAFGKKIHCPDFMNKTISNSSCKKIIDWTIYILGKTEKFVKPRLTILSTNPYLHMLHGVLIFFLGLTLALPLPIPLTNILVAAPIVFLGLGLLEDDGVFVIIGYLFAFLAIGFFGSILWYGFAAFG